MTVIVEGLEIRLTGRCGVEEAETLLAALNAAPERRVVLAAERIHTSLWQVLLASGSDVEGQPPDWFSSQFILPLIARKNLAP